MLDKQFWTTILQHTRQVGRVYGMAGNLDNFEQHLKPADRYLLFGKYCDFQTLLQGKHKLFECRLAFFFFFMPF